MTGSLKRTLHNLVSMGEKTMATQWTWLPDGMTSTYTMKPAAKIDGAEMVEYGDNTGFVQVKGIDDFHDLIYTPEDRQFRVERFRGRSASLSDQSYATAKLAIEAWGMGWMTWKE